MEKPRTILVTGGAGFIGSHVARCLGEQGHTLILVDNLNDYYDPSLKKARLQTLLANTPHTFYHVDIADEPAMQKIFETHAIDQICHQAAQAGVRYAQQAPFVYGHSNLMGTLTILELARLFQVKGIVMASSSSVYGDAKQYPVKETDVADQPISLYAATKRATELLAYSYHHLYNLPITCLRYFTVYGPWGRPDMALFTFTKAALEGKPIAVYGHGQMARDFTYIDDIVNGIVRALEVNLPWAILNLGRGKAEPLMSMIESIEQTIGKTLEKKFVEMQPGDVQQTWADISQARAQLGWEPRVNLEEGIKKFVSWYKGYGGV
ncbi:NAD-dependent epimerase/dehydratase family protein [Patescibacteria group bacterium]|nr:MAG: NAD-dependent epimerase/dehydratase family protein [Patescibacteria group bacterium]